jgi:hypothetical protein
MDEGWPRREAETEYRRRTAERVMRRPDRIALWAVGIAVVGMIAAAASAHGATGPVAKRAVAGLHHASAGDVHVVPIGK